MMAETQPDSVLPGRQSELRPKRRVYRRRLRNLVLQPKFQLKYSAMVAGVTFLVGGVLGAYAYNYSRGQTDLLALHQLESAQERGQSITPQLVAAVQTYAERTDQHVLWAVVLGVLGLSAIVGATAVVITHRFVGPAYRLKRLSEQVRQGQWSVPAPLRRGDEFKDVFESFQEMILAMREARERELELLAQVQALAATTHGEGGGQELEQALESLHARMGTVLEMPPQGRVPSRAVRS